jgi:iron only hydrogenase large subunit-like protein
MVHNQPPPPHFLELTAVRGLLPARAKLKMATVALWPERTLSVAVVQGLAHARALLKQIASGALKVDFVEIMACEGGCIGGAGMPLSKIQPYVSKAMRQARLEALQAQDTNQANVNARVSWLNPPVRQLYDDFYGAPASSKAAHYLHTTYRSRAHGLGEKP